MEFLGGEGKRGAIAVFKPRGPKTNQPIDRIMTH